MVAILEMKIGSPAHHRLLAYYEMRYSEWKRELASYHWQKYVVADTNNIPIPHEPPSLHLFRTGEYCDFCRAVGLVCLPDCEACSEGSNKCRDEGGG